MCCGDIDRRQCESDAQAKVHQEGRAVLVLYRNSTRDAHAFCITTAHAKHTRSVSQQHTRSTRVLDRNSTRDAQAKARRSVLSANVHFTKDGSAALPPVAPPELLCDRHPRPTLVAP